MARATSVKSFTDSLSSSSPCLCLHSMSSSSLNTIKANTAPFCYENTKKRMQQVNKLRKVDLSSSFLDAFHVKMLSYCPTSNGCSKTRCNKAKGLVIVGELGGQYEDTFNDVKMEIINYFTFKAVRTVLEQLYEMNPPQYLWFHNFIADNLPEYGKRNGTRFLQTLVKESQVLAERVMITRLSLYGRWIKKCDHGEIYKEISDDNLKLMRERLLETIIWPSDESDQKTD